VAILRNCAKAMRNPNGKVILVELVISPSSDIELAKWVDVDMLVAVGGRERTEAEFTELLVRSGLRLARVIQTPSASA